MNKKTKTTPLFVDAETSKKINQWHEAKGGDLPTSGATLAPSFLNSEQQRARGGGSISPQSGEIEGATLAPIFSWEAPEAIKHEKGTTWFILAALLAGVLVFYAIWTNSWTMAVATIVLAGVYTLSHHREPRHIEVKITSLGIQAGNRTIPYNHIKAFWIVYNPPQVKILKLMTTDKLMAELSIQLDGQAPGPVREYLLKQIPEYEGKSESLADLIIRHAKL